jgi:hypothetical protein
MENKARAASSRPLVKDGKKGSPAEIAEARGDGPQNLEKRVAIRPQVEVEQRFHKAEQTKRISIKEAKVIERNEAAVH